MRSFLRIGLVASLILFASSALAVDRAVLVQSKISATLSSILPQTDFLVIVNRVESLDATSGVTSLEAQAKPLPGLNLGVNPNGDVVPQGSNGSSYLGPIIARIVIDEKVSQKTYQLIESLMTEIAGGAQDADEVTITRSQLRQDQKPADSRPQITINNNGPEKDSQKENLKFISLFLVTAGLLFWILSRLGAKRDNNDRQAGSSGANNFDKNSDPAVNRKAVSETDFTIIDPQAVAVYLVKSLREDKMDKVSLWRKSAGSTQERQVYGHLPTWMLSFFHQKFQKHQELVGEADAKNEQAVEVPSQAADLFSEMVLAEQGLRTEAAKARTFLEWFSPEALRFVPAAEREKVSQRTKAVLWFLRPDLGFFSESNDPISDPYSEKNEVPVDDLIQAFAELKTLSTNEFERRTTEKVDAVARWAMAINKLTEFSPIDSQLEQAGKKLAAADFSRLKSLVVSAQTPLEFSVQERKDWLRFLDPEDFIWWKKIINHDPEWKLEDDLRNLKLAAFRQAEEENGVSEWSEAMKKQASARLLESIRKVRFRESDHAQSA